MFGTELTDHSDLVKLNNALKASQAVLSCHGSGIDATWTVQFDFNSNSIILANSYHAMDSDGSYLTWLSFKVTIPLQPMKDHPIDEYELDFDDNLSLLQDEYLKQDIDCYFEDINDLLIDHFDAAMKKVIKTDD